MGGRVGPDVALSHNSYAQIAAARSLGIPAVTAMDFEHQPANHLAFRLATTVLVPELLPLRVIRRQGAVQAKVVRYPGLKEELYFGDFEPDTEILTKLGIDPRPRIVAVLRTPPTRAVYHSSSNPLFEATLPRALRTVGGRRCRAHAPPRADRRDRQSRSAPTASCPAPRSTLDRSCTRPM